MVGRLLAADTVRTVLAAQSVVSEASQRDENQTLSQALKVAKSLGSVMQLRAVQRTALDRRRREGSLRRRCQILRVKGLSLTKQNNTNRGMTKSCHIAEIGKLTWRCCK